MTTNEILQHKIFNDIDMALSFNNYKNVWALLQTETPLEWCNTGVNETTKEQYYYLRIEVLEALVERIFGGYEDIKCETQFLHTPTSIAVTSTVIIGFAFNNEFQKQKAGTATVVVSDNFYFKDGQMKFYAPNTPPLKAIEQLQTATPLSLTEARKNALKNICNLFSRNLNRKNEDELPTIPFVKTEKKITPDAIVKQKYKNALKKEDVKAIEELELIYDFVEIKPNTTPAHILLR